MKFNKKGNGWLLVLIISIIIAALVILILLKFQSKLLSFLLSR